MTTETDTETHNVAIYGITGAIGRELHAALEVEHEGISELIAVAGAASAGQIVRWRGGALSVRGAGEVAPVDVDFALFATPPDAVTREAPRLLEAGARVIDASGVLASPPLPRGLTAPATLAWPRLASTKNLDLETETAIALPGGAASTLAPVLDALVAGHSVLGLPALKAVRGTVLLPASHAGKGGIDALSRQAVGMLNYQPALDPSPFPSLLAFNVVVPPPGSAVLFEAKATSELRRLVAGLDKVGIELQPLWIAAFSGVAMVLHLEFEGRVDPLSLEKVLDSHPDLELGSGDEPAVEAPEPDDDELELDIEVPDEATEATEALSLRDTLDSDKVRIAPPIFNGHDVRLVLMADPLHRTAAAATSLLVQWMAILEQ
jgi:aspartate-semialdehyde dehydrogenase